MNTHLERRTLLRAGAATGAGLLLSAGAAACSDDSAHPAAASALIEPTDPAVAAVEAARYHSGASRTFTLDAVPGKIDLGGVIVSTWTYGGVLPGSELRVNRGDVVDAHLVNHLPEETTVHWHGVAIRNNMDGVPQLTQSPVAPGASQTYTFTAANPGTYWLHPHVGVQQDRGLYAPLIVDDPGEKADYDHEWTIVLDDWIDGTGYTPDQVLAALQNTPAPGGPASGAATGMGSGSAAGGNGVVLMDATSPLLGGDAGDVRYPYFLINGRLRTDPVTFTARSGQRARIRIINAGSDTAFRVALGGHTLTVTHTDGYPVVPVETTSLLLGMGERYDVEVTLGDGVFPLVASAEGKNSTALAVVRTASGRAPSPDVRPAELSTDPIGYGALRPAEPYRLKTATPQVAANLRLTVSKTSYTWMINDTVYNPERPLMRVESGQRVQLTWTNTTTMWHPMHLHGHTFQLAGGGPRKDTVIVLPGRSVTVEFDADNPGQWMMHCHNTYHAGTGMMGVVGYQTKA